MECRIYAEDPYNGFIPSIGSIHFLQEPQGEGLRIDTGVTQNSAITMYYDPMIAKLIAKGQNREEALQRLTQALSHYHIGGVKTNIPFLQAIAQNEQFKNAHFSTDFLSKETITLAHPNSQLAVLMAVSVDYLNISKQIKDPLCQDSFGWQAHKKTHWVWRYQLEELIEAVILPISQDEFKLILNEKEHFIRAGLQDNELRIETNQQTYKAIIENTFKDLTLYSEQGQISIQRFEWGASDSSSGSKGQLTAPMPATIVAILRNLGERVKAGDSLIVLEAMKMEHTIHAPKDGILTDIFYPVGAQVNEGAELISLSEET